MTETYVDSADVKEIEKFIGWGIAKGVTTNPKIFKETASGCNFEERAKEILELVYPLPVSLEGPNNYQGILDAADKYSKWTIKGTELPYKNLVIKVPMLGNGDGLKAVKVLSERDIKTNVTACMNTNQTFLAACAGATYVSLFYNRMIDWKYSQLEPKWKLGTPKVFDICSDTVSIANRTAKERQEISIIKARQYALDIIGETMDMLVEGDFKTKLIVGSIREPRDIEWILTELPHIITIPTGILDQMPNHDATNAALKDFDNAWKEFCAGEKKL
jgi:transaldolase